MLAALFLASVLVLPLRVPRLPMPVVVPVRVPVPASVCAVLPRWYLCCFRGQSHDRVLTHERELTFQQPFRAFQNTLSRNQ